MRQPGRPIALAAFLAAQLISIFHLGFAPHEICEHGELVDVDSAVHVDAPADANADGHGAPGPGTTDNERHDDCPLLLHNGQTLAVAPLELSHPLLFSDGSASAFEAVGAARPPLSVLDVAPKTSPPA